MALLEPKAERIAPQGSPASADAAPAWVAGGTPEPLRSDLVTLLGAERVLSRASDIVRYASDASPYRLFPKVVVMAHDAADVAKVLVYARRTGTPVTFRAGGTSLNGQGQSDGILIDVRRHFRGVEVLDGGARARVKPGTVLGHANRVLAPHGYKLGPDPASTDIACVGGVIANNSGGMRCGVTHDSYRTVSALTFALPSGTEIDSAADGAEERFAAAEPELAAGLLEIREEILADAELGERIRHKFEIKNTTGYRLCAFLDAETPLEIFRRLLVGSEGTLAFISEAVFETVAQPARTTVSWLHFPSVDAALEPVPAFIAAGARAVELMVAPALIIASQFIRGTPESWRELDPFSAALLVEFGGDDEAELDAAEARAATVLADRELIREPDFHRDAETIELAWTVREGLHGLLGKMRAPGTSLIIEDVCVPPARMAEMAKDLQALLTEHGFLPGVAGHASAGNLHFMLTPDFSKPEDLERYDAFMDGLVTLVIDEYDGSLKAEHGTGVNMAPFVEREWGAKATELMRRVKRLADPDGVLAPGVVINDDPGVHLRNLKTTPSFDEEVDNCVECGFCEPVCPSRHLTTTPRQRIVLAREMVRQAADSPVLEALLAEYEYDALETCAADGTCLLACPVGIDTGKFVKSLRARQHSARAEKTALRLAGRWESVERATRAGLAAGDRGRVARGALRGASRAARRALSEELVPEWPQNMPRPAPAALPATTRGDAAAVYLPACVNRIFGRARNGSPAPGQGLPEALVTISTRAGRPLWIPDDVAGHCCATPWTSKGYAEGARRMANHTIDALWRWSDGGALPIVCDASSCTLGLAEEAVPLLSEVNAERHSRLRILDSIAWARELLPELEVRRKLRSVAVHPPCASRHLELDGALAELAAELADEVVVPIAATCCGFAGDRGMLHPELPAAATADQAAELDNRLFDAHLCSNRTCEIGLQQGTGRTYESFVFTLEELTRP
ncbi:MAG: D-lactate dehydrogenase [Solirubrobacterales bacterium]|nr:D-lactate dehydrogenase [Solirubrobacterales bacterium]